MSTQYARARDCQVEILAGRGIPFRCLICRNSDIGLPVHSTHKRDVSWRKIAITLIDPKKAKKRRTLV